MARIAVIGGGISGLGAAWALQGAHDVTLYEADARPGGHANTVEVQDGARSVPVDTGFIVYNELNYPTLTRLFQILGVATESSDMSFSVASERGRLRFHSRVSRMLRPATNALRPSLWWTLRDFRRFCVESPRVLWTDTHESLGAFLDRGGYTEAFRSTLLLPMTAAIWSCGTDDMLEFPTSTVVRFLSSHRMLQLGGRPGWRTVTGGSRRYVDALTKGYRDRIRYDTPVRAVRRHGEDVEVRDDAGGIDRFDAIVLATHADTALRILGGDATPQERTTLESFAFTNNRAVLHRDPSFMPRRHSGWASWNYLREDAAPACLTYWMNRLQNLHTARPIFLTMNPSREPRGDTATFRYSHPRFDRNAVEAQKALPLLQGVRRTWFAGAWTGFGFHEDGLRSGLQVAAALGAYAPWRDEPSREPVMAAG